MWFHYTVTVPAGTAESAPSEKSLKIAQGVIVWLGVGFPGGCNQLVKVRLFHAESQIFPTNPDEPASWSGDIEGGRMHYVVKTQPYALVARCYSPSAGSNHDVTILVNVLPLKVAEPWREFTKAIDKISKLLGVEQ